AVGVVAVALQVVAPGLAPESGGDGPALNLDGPNLSPLLGQLPRVRRRQLAPLGRGHIGTPVAVEHGSAFRERAMDVKRYQAQKLSVAQLGQQRLAAAFEDL